MNDLNSVLVEGSIAGIPVIEKTKNDYPCFTMMIGNDRWYRKGEVTEKETNFFECVGYGENLTGSAEKLKKGDRVRIAGRVRQDRWEPDSGYRSKIVFVVEHLEFLRRR